MRIALLSYEYPPETGFGGIGTYTYYHARALARLGHEVHVFAGSMEAERRTERDGNVTVTRFRKFGPVERMVPTSESRGLSWFRNRLQTATNMFAAIRRELLEREFDVVEMPECGGEGAWINHFLDLPTVVRLHSPAELIMPTYDSKAADRILTAAIERLGIIGARALSTCSHWLAGEVRSRMAIDRPIAVIPNGIDLALFDQDEGIDIHERFAVPHDRITVFFANRLENRKGIHIVRDLLVETLERHPDVCFVIAGADPDEIVPQQLLPMLRERGLEHGLCYIGKLGLNEVRACLKQTDVFLLPSTWENAPYSLLEAMSASKAIVASDCGGVPEMVRHEIDGLIARTNDVGSFRRALDRVLKQESLRRRFGESARQRIEARFTDELVARRSLDFYQWALDAPGGARVTIAGGATVDPLLRVGPDNWFQVWWMRGVAIGERPVLRAATEAEPSLARATLEQLSFVHRMLARTYWETCGRSGVVEADFLDELESMQRERAVAVREGASQREEVPLSFPALSHPVFADEVSAGRFIDELWRLGDSDALAEWLVRETTAVNFVERASRRVSWRRLAVEACRRRPGPKVFATLHGLYRTVVHHAGVVQKDQEFIADDPHGDAFRQALDELGLHAPLRRPAVFGRRRTKPGDAPSEVEVTVLIPAYCHEGYIESTIRSVLDQTHERLRVLVVDDQSSDDTSAVARAIDDPRVEVRVNDRNMGLGASVAAALESIETPYVALLNSDDLFHPTRLERCVAAMESGDSPALVTSRVALMDSGGKRLTEENVCAIDQGSRGFGWVRWYAGVTASLESPPEWASLPALLRHNHLATSSNIFCRTDFLRSHAGAMPGLNYCLDWWLFLMAAVEGRLAVLKDELVAYRLHDSNTVWFEKGGREDYVHEVNHVVASVLAALVERRRGEGVDDALVAEEIAELIDQHVSRHGETDGFELVLSALAGRFGEGGEACIRLARAALEAKQRRQALAGISVPPYEIARAVEDAEARRADAHVAELFTDRVRALEREIGRLRAESRDPSDAKALRLRLDEVRAQFGTEIRDVRDLLDRNLEWARVSEVQHRRELEQMRETHEWRAGRLLLHKLRLNGLFKTAICVHTHLSVRGGRLLARLGRKLRRTPPRAVILCPGRFPSADAGQVAAEARLLQESGAETRVLCWGVGSREALAAGDEAIVALRSVLVLDPSLANGDRRWFEHNRPEVTALVLERLGAGEDLHAVFVPARSAMAQGAGYIQGSGLGYAAICAWSVGDLLGVPFGITVTGRDLEQSHGDPPPDLLRAASLICVDSEATAAALGEALGEVEVPVLVRPPPVFADADGATTAPETGLFAVVGPVGRPDALLILADAVKLAIDRGVDVRVELLGEGVLTGENLQAFSWLRGRIRELDLTEFFKFGSLPESARVAELISRAGAVIEPVAVGVPGALSRTVVAAFSAGRPIIGFEGQLNGMVRDQTEGLVVALGDVDGLANAMIELATAPERARSLGAAARVRYEGLLDPSVAARAFCDRVHELLASSSDPDRPDELPDEQPK